MSSELTARIAKVLIIMSVLAVLLLSLTIPIMLML